MGYSAPAYKGGLLYSKGKTKQWMLFVIQEKSNSEKKNSDD